MTSTQKSKIELPLPSTSNAETNHSRRKTDKLTSGINIGYINVRSVLPKIDQVQHLLNFRDLHVLGVGETWLDNNIDDKEIGIDGYSIIRSDRNRHGGGVMFYVHDSLSYQQVQLIGHEVESIWLKFDIDRKKFVLGNIYRPPRSDIAYFDKILDLIEQAMNVSDNVIVIGDLNIDYKVDASLTTNPILQIEALFQMKQLVNAPTRTTIDTSSLIDIILTRVPEVHVSTEVLHVTMSDHFPVITRLRSQQKLQNEHKTVRFRDYKHFEVDDFLDDLKSSLNTDQQLELVKNKRATPDSEIQWQHFKKTFLEVSERHAPIKTMRMKQRYCPWINNEILTLMYKRDYLHRLACRNSCENTWNEYKRHRNLVTSTIRAEKRKYFDNELCNNMGNPKQFWKKINMLTGQQTKDTAAKEISAENFNDHFSNIGHTVVNNNSSKNVNEPLKWKNPPCTHMFKFTECSITDVSDYIKTLGCDSNIDVLGFDARLIHLSCHVISPFIVLILNASFSSSKLPNDWKFSRVTPVFKGKGSKADKNNYRPISVICHIAKVIEKVVQKQLLHYLLLNELIVLDQSAYRPMFNTQTALHRVVDSWIDNVCDGLLTGVCLLDIRKCFDTIDHNLLREKLAYYGVKGVELQWFSDYLSNRSQVVFHNKVLSDKNEITIGVPQGSVLGPTLFMLFINDISQNSGIGICNLYADDVIVYCDGSTLQEVNVNLQNSVSQLTAWYENNKLSINTSKSEVMLVSSPRRVFSDDLDITINGENLKFVQCANYLGMKLDCHLSWNDYVDKLCSSVACKLNRLRRLKGLVNKNVMTKIYVTTIQPCIDYGISIWGQTSKFNILKIQRLQNYAARLVTNNFDYLNCSSSAIIKSLRWMTVKQRCIYFTIVLMFKCIHGLAPFYLINDVVMNFDVNGFNTRSHPMNVYIPQVSSQLAKRAFKYIGASLWNDLPSFLKDTTDINNFKRKLRQHILTTT